MQLKNDRMISIHLQGKAPFDITAILVYAPASKAEEAEVEPTGPYRANTHKRYHFHYRGLE